MQRLFFVMFCLIASLLIASCSMLSTANQQNQQKKEDAEKTNEAFQNKTWNGRLSLRIHASEYNQASSLSAEFELSGNPEKGYLRLFNPLGITFVNLRWQPNWAQLQANGKTEQFESLSVLLENLLLQLNLKNAHTENTFPIQALFYWLDNQSLSVSGWNVNLEELKENKRLNANRFSPEPEVDLRVILNP